MAVAAAAALADVLITEFLISNISQKRGARNESGRGGREGRVAANGGAARMTSRDPSGQRQCQPASRPTETRLIPFSFFQPIERGRSSHATNRPIHRESTVWQLFSLKNKMHRSAAAAAAADCFVLFHPSSVPRPPSLQHVRSDFVNER